MCNGIYYRGPLLRRSGRQHRGVAHLRSTSVLKGPPFPCHCTGAGGRVKSDRCCMAHLSAKWQQHEWIHTAALPTPVPPPSSNSKDEYDHHSSAISSHTHCAITLPPPSLPGGGVIAGSDSSFLIGLVFHSGSCISHRMPRP